MKHLEIELKTLLKKDEYNRLKDQFTGVTPVLQKNYYMDTPDFELREKKVALRIRTFEDWAELTLSLIHISEPTRHFKRSRMPSSA